MPDFTQTTTIKAMQLEYRDDGRVKDWDELSQLACGYASNRQNRIYVDTSDGRRLMKEGEWIVQVPPERHKEQTFAVYGDVEFKALFQEK